MPDISDVPVFVLCGGLGTRLREETEHRPKPMVTVGEHVFGFAVNRVRLGGVGKLFLAT